MGVEILLQIIQITLEEPLFIHSLEAIFKKHTVWVYECASSSGCSFEDPLWIFHFKIKWIKPYNLSKSKLTGKHDFVCKKIHQNVVSLKDWAPFLGANTAGCKHQCVSRVSVWLDGLFARSKLTVWMSPYTSELTAA